MLKKADEEMDKNWNIFTINSYNNKNQ
jgi:hypothetical protein